MSVQTAVQIASSLEGILEGTPVRGAVLISHGAGGSMTTGLLTHTAQRLSELGFLTLRFNFGYVGSGQRGMPSTGGKREIPEMNAAIDFLTDRANGKPVILIGKSFGGRVSTYAAAQRNDVADITGYVFYGLPIQGMSKHSKPRDWSHLSKLRGRALFVTGDKDKLCPLEQLIEVQKCLTIPFESTVVPGDHSYKPKGESSALDYCVHWMDVHFK